MKRILFITTRKTGSQWIRNLLTDRELMPEPVIQYRNTSVDLAETVCPPILDGEFAGPIYHMFPDFWQLWAQPEDRAIVVMRDPRDCLVSFLYSALYSHELIDENQYLFRKLLSAVSPQDKLLWQLLGIHTSVHWMTSWISSSDTRVLLQTYEEYVENTQSALERALAHIGRTVDPGSLAEVVKIHSFESQTGRKPGQADPLSHCRNGKPGDWRRVFSRSLGQTFEQVYARCLILLKYETSESWWEHLDEGSLVFPALATDEQQRIKQQLYAANSELKAKETQIHLLANEVTLLREECYRRLQNIDAANTKLEAKENQIRLLANEVALLRHECGRRLEALQEQSAAVAEYRAREKQIRLLANK